MIVDLKKDTLLCVTKYFSKKLSMIFNKLLEEEELSKILEIRIKTNQPIIVRSINGINFISEEAHLTQKNSNTPIIATQNDLNECFEKICEYSIYSHESEIMNGFITIKGGHRIGICGTAVKKDGKITSIKNISSLNIRLSREILGAADDLLNKISYNDLGILIVGPPSSGKTTLLRDIARQLSEVQKKCVTIVDERGELAATYNGVPQKNIGLCDVLNEYPKAQGILQAIRTLAPEVIVCDEIGGTEDIFAIQQCLNAGVEIISSIHASNLNSLLKRPQVKELLSTGAFKKLVFLDSKQPTKIKEIIKVDDLYVKTNRIYNYHSLRNSTRLSPFQQSLQTY